MSADDSAADQVPRLGDYWRDPDVPDALCFTVTQGGTAHRVSHVIGREGPIPLFARWELTPARWRASPGQQFDAQDPLPTLAETLDAVRWLASEAESVLRSDWREDPTDAQVDAKQQAVTLLHSIKVSVDASKK